MQGLTIAVAGDSLIAPPSRPPRAGEQNVQSEVTRKTGEKEEEGGREGGREGGSYHNSSGQSLDSSSFPSSLSRRPTCKGQNYRKGKRGRGGECPRPTHTA